MNRTSDKVEVGVGEFLRHMGYDAPDTGRMDSPLRDDSDSNSFVITDMFWHDHVSGDGGNTYQLAILMHGDDPKEALKSMYEAKGLPWTEYRGEATATSLAQRMEATDILAAIKDAYPAKDGPKEVKDYLKSRMVTSKTIDYFSFVPKGELSKVVSKDWIERLGLYDIEDKIIFWYLRSGKPVYYCTRSITDKEFRKGSLGSGLLEHPIWNVDDLYTKERVIWGEGMFDCISFLELGYGVAGEITCNLIETHKPELLKALRWRETNHPDWTFTICLDNDAPDSMGIRRGNAAANKIALWLLGEGINARWLKWTKEEEEADVKIDINALHTQGGYALNGFISRLDSAPWVSDLVQSSFDESVEYYLRSIAAGHNKTAIKILNSALVRAEEQGNMPNKTTLNNLIRKTRIHWRKIWDKDISFVFMDNKKYYVFYRCGFFPSHIKEHYRVFDGLPSLIENLKEHQINRDFDVRQIEIVIPSKTLTWQVAKETPAEKDKSPCFNMFDPSPILLQKPTGTQTELPPMWSLLLDNLAGDKEKEWLLDHFATYVQTLRKPFTIPVFEGEQGTGKTALMQLFGKGIGSFVAIGNREIESSFNAYMMRAVVLFDEVSNSNRDSVRLKNMLKSLVNPEQQINLKYMPEFTINCNNYIAMAYNPQDFANSISIEQGDRRYSIITGGKNQNLAKNPLYDYDQLDAELPQFFDHLMTRKIINLKCFSIPIENTQKDRIKNDSKSIHFDRIDSFMEIVKTNPDYFKVDDLFIPDVDSNGAGYSVTLLREIYNKHYHASLTAKSFNDLLSSDHVSGEVSIYKSSGIMSIKYTLPKDTAKDKFPNNNNTANTADKLIDNSDLFSTWEVS